MRAAWVCAVLPLLAATTQASLAQASPSSRLTYVRGPGAAMCPDEEALRRAVAARLGFDPFFPVAERTVVTEITRSGDVFRAKLSIVDNNGVSMGERALPPQRDCSELVKSVALAISIALDDLGPATPPPPTAEPTPEPDVPATPSTPPPPRDAPHEGIARENPPPPAEVPAAAPIVFGAQVALTSSFGLAPATSFGLAPAVRVGTRAFWGSVGGRFDLSATRAVAPGGEVRATLVAFEPGICAAAGGGIRLVACAESVLGSYAPRVSGIDAPRREASAYVALGGRVAVEGDIGDVWFLSGYATALASLTPHRLTINGATVHQLPTVGATFGLGAGMRFP